MPELTACQTADFFVLRTPGLPLDALFPGGPAACVTEAGGSAPASRLEDKNTLRQRLRDLVRQDAVREALALASPDLAARIGPWLAGTLEVAAARQVEGALLKYLSRMSSRSTPFGLFAGLSLGAWASASQISVGHWRGCRKALRLDWGVLEALVDGLEQAPEVRASLVYRPNSSLYARGGWYRYLERRKQAEGQGRTYHLEAVEATPHLDFVLQEAQEGVSLEELAKTLARRSGVEPKEAQCFLEQVIQAQVLCGDLQPPLTGPDPMGWVSAALQANSATAPKAEPLVALGLALKALQAAPIGAHPEGYGHLAAPLGALGIPADTRDVLQVDLFRPAPGLALSSRVRRRLEAGVDLLRRLTPPAPEGPLDRFRGAFLERYGTRWMPLLEVLDEESGLGFDGGVPMDSPLLEGLAFPGSLPSRPFTARDQLLLDLLTERQGSQVWELTDADVAALANPDPQPFPLSFAALASLGAPSLGALDRGDFQFWLEQYSGPTAARWLGRFASGEPALKEALHQHLRKEEAFRPEALFAEVVHVPEGRMGNILARPALREYEIPFLATAGVARDKTILPGDLQVTVQGGRVLLASQRLGREVVPRLSSAHNFARGPVVYRFLAHLQDQDGRAGGWSWGALAEQAFLPRVTRGRQVLSRARWRIRARELKAAVAASADGAWGAFQSLRDSRNLPRFVMLTDADNTLLVDLDQRLWVETLHHLVASRSQFTLTECFPGPDQALVTAPEGRFAHELVIPFEAGAPAPSKVKALPSMIAGSSVRAYPPGSEWLYLKLYCGPASVDRLLVEAEPFLRGTETEGLWDRWHFVRYADPEQHLRLRFHGQPQRLLSELLPRIHSHLERPLAQGLLWKWQVDTFEPEVERYGGALGLGLAEAWFFEDSEAVLQGLVRGMTMAERWKTGLAEVDAIWAALGLSLPERSELARASRESFRKEFGDTGEGAVQMGVKFRALRKELEGALHGVPEVTATPGLAGLRGIREAFDQGLLQGERASLAGSLAHMHLNRLLRINHRENEWVLMEFLCRLYESQLARAKPN
jgi:thiopeptide-type bacteriocin biosynthesis protein